MLESKRKAIIFFIISLLLALTAGFLILKKVQSLNSNLGTMVHIVVAADDVPSRAVIRPQDVNMEEIPSKYVREDHIVDVKDLVNKVSIVPLSKGDVITKNMLKQASSIVEENNRLITIMASDRVYFDEELEPLDRVDIVVSHRFNSKEETNYFMKDVKVARTSKEDGDYGVQLEVPVDKAPELIHMQNYADSVRIVKANVGKLEEEKAEAEQKEPPKEEPEKAPEEPKEQGEEEQKPEEEKQEEKAE